jgi:hypothetical protein
MNKDIAVQEPNPEINDNDSEKSILASSHQSPEIEVSISKIKMLFDKYRGNAYMTSRIHGVICNQFPQMLDTIDNNYRERNIKYSSMVNEQENFIELFLTNNKYFYCEKTDKFFYYNNDTYKLFDEDDILHLILSTITKSQSIMTMRKKKTQNNIMQRIKMNNILKTVPETKTIQRVIDILFPHLFPSRNMAKYFLTIVGDNIFRKNTSLVHFINNNAKNFIRNINNISSYIFGTNMHQTFKYKYHEHAYESCRIIETNSCISIPEIWINIISEYGVDIICVASHYSIKHGSSDNFISTISLDESLANSVYYLKNHSQSQVVDIFINSYLTLSSVQSTTSSSVVNIEISWKNIQYLWKHFLSTSGLPSIMFQQTLKEHLILKLNDRYVEERESFRDILSKFLPNIQIFLQFWEETIVIDEGETDFEIEEMVELFRIWSGGQIITNGSVSDIISHYHPEIDIEGYKYIQKIRSRLWDKHLDLQIAINIIRDDLIFSKNIIIGSESDALSEELYCISIYKMYVKYISIYSITGDETLMKKPIVSKQYFNRYISENMFDYIVDSEYISMKWIQSG